MNFTISESKDTADFSKYEYPSTCSVPLTIGYINENIKTNYTFPVTTSSNNDGKLLRQSVITLDSIACNVSFDIHIVNNLDEHFKCSINFDIPFKNENNNSSIYDGYFIKELTDFENYVFVKE